MLKLMPTLRRWARFDAYPLEPYRDRIAGPLSLLAAALLLPFVVGHLANDRWLLAGLIGGAVGVLLYNGLAVLRGARPPVPYFMLAVGLSLVVCGSVWLQGINGTYWAFPTLFICYLILRRGPALLLTLALIVVLTGLSAWVLGWAIALRLVATLSLTLGMINVLLDVIDELQHALERQAVTDALTGAFNRRHLDAELRRLEAAGAGTHDWALVALDVDHFKRINDTHGHAAGDEVLRRVAAEIAARKRRDDVLFRTGGEEFMLLLPGARVDQAAILSEDLRVRIEQSDLLPGERITVSIGVAAHVPGEHLVDWAKRADAALYQAKRQGRNQVICAD